MKLPVDTSAIAFLCAMQAEPVVDFETRRPKADENGEPLYVIEGVRDAGVMWELGAASGRGR